MPIIFAGISPHPPILIPAIGKDNLKKIKKTQLALEKLEQELYAAKPDTVIVISPHGKILNDAFSINLSIEYEAGLEEFGDFSTKMKFKSDYMSIQEIRSADETKGKVPLVLVSEEKIDHGALIPLYYLLKHLPNTPIIPIYYSLLDCQAHYDFGKFLNNQIAKISKRIAIVASGDLSHRLTKNAPAGYSKQGEVFDKKLIELLEANKTDQILKIDEELIKEAGQCGLKSILILLGLLNGMNYKTEVFSYEKPFGVGYLVANMKLA